MKKFVFIVDSKTRLGHVCRLQQTLLFPVNTGNIGYFVGNLERRGVLSTRKSYYFEKMAKIVPSDISHRFANA